MTAETPTGRNAEALAALAQAAASVEAPPCEGCALSESCAQHNTACGDFYVYVTGKRQRSGAPDRFPLRVVALLCDRDEEQPRASRVPPYDPPELHPVTVRGVTKPAAEWLRLADLTPRKAAGKLLIGRHLSEDIPNRVETRRLRAQRRLVGYASAEYREAVAALRKLLAEVETVKRRHGLSRRPKEYDAKVRAARRALKDAEALRASRQTGLAKMERGQ